MGHRVILGAALVAGSMLVSACAGNSTAGSLPAATAPFGAAAATNVIKNPGFETGKLSPWKTVGAKPGVPVISNSKWHSGKYSVFIGTSAPPAVKDLHAIAQTVKVPAGGKLSWWYLGSSNDEIKYGDQEVDVVVGGKIVDTCYKALVTSTTWKEGKCTLTKYVGQTVTLEFGVYDNGYDKTYVDEYIDDISLT